MRKIIGLMRVRNEAWVLRYSARVALQWCDELVVLDHASTDATPEIIDEIARETGRVTALHEPDPEWREMAHLQRLLDVGRERGGDVFPLIDGDEIVTANLMPGVRESILRTLAPGEMMCSPWLNLWRSLDVYRRDASRHGKHNGVLAFRDAQSLGWPKNEQFHHRPPVGISRKHYWPPEGQGGIMHLQRSSWRRAEARQSLYKMVEALRWPNKSHVEIDLYYHSALEEEGAKLHEVPAAWWAHGLDRDLIDLDSEPWESAECARMMAEHGPGRFAGMRLLYV